MRKPTPESVPPEPELKLESGQTIHLSLFDPGLAGVFEMDERFRNGAGCGLRCQCSARVVEQGDESLYVSMPSCPNAGRCLEAGRTLYGWVPDASRTAFVTDVLEPDGVSGLLRMSRVREVHSGQRRRCYRVPFFPDVELLIRAWPLNRLSDADAVMDACLSGGSCDASLLPPAVLGGELQAGVIDLSPLGVGLAVRGEASRRAVTRVPIWLLLIELPGLDMALPCPARVRWSDPVNESVMRFGLEFVTQGHPKLASHLEKELGDWLTVYQRERLRRSKPRV